MSIITSAVIFYQGSCDTHSGRLPAFLQNGRNYKMRKMSVLKIEYYVGGGRKRQSLGL